MPLISASFSGWFSRISSDLPCGSDPLYGTAGQISIDLIRGGGQHPNGIPRLELLPVGGMGHPGSGGNDAFTGGHIGKASHNGLLLIVGISEAEHGIAIFHIAVKHGRDNSAQFFLKFNILIHKVFHPDEMKNSFRQPAAFSSDTVP